jgi:putative chitinase
MITKPQLIACIGTDTIYDAVVAVFPKYEINTSARIAGFLSQCGHESNNFSVLKENLMYSAEGLLKVFPKYFKTPTDASAYAKQPAKIANKIYASRMGNGNEASGDGYKFRGRGAIQITGKTNYTAFAKSVSKELDDAVAYAETLQGAIESACWYWSTNKLNTYCDKSDIIGLTKKINGGTIGLDDRTARYNKYLTILS